MMEDLILRFDVLVVLLYGFGLSILSEAFHTDKQDPDTPLSLKKILWENSNKWKTLGSTYMIFGMALVLPHDLIVRLLEIKYQDMRVGFISVVVIGFVADDMFFMLDKASRKIIKGKF